MKLKINFTPACLCAFAVLLQLSGCYTPIEYEYAKVIYVPNPSLTMYVGDEFQLTANPVSETFDWSSEQPTVASVTSSGLVKALLVGETNIVVSQNTLRKQIPVSVVVPVAEKVGIAQKGRTGARITMNIATQKIKTVKLTHGDEIRNVNIDLQSGTFNIDFDNVPDGRNVFGIVYVDNFGNESPTANFSLNVVHPKNRSIRVATKFGNGLAISWQDKMGDYCDIFYTDENGAPASFRAPVSDNNSYIFGFKSDFSCSTVYLADEIDPVDFASEASGYDYQDKSHTLSSSAPYVITARDFDLGGEGVGYHDNDSQNNGGNYYRRDACGDDNSGGADIEGGGNFGYTNSGEWLMFTVDVLNAGTYMIDYNLSVNNGTGADATFEVDGTALPIVHLENNNNWGDYKWYFGERHPSMTAPTVYLSAGRHKLKFLCVSGGFNYMSFKFTYKS